MNENPKMPSKQKQDPTMDDTIRINLLERFFENILIATNSPPGTPTNELRSVIEWKQSFLALLKISSLGPKPTKRERQVE